MIHPDNNSWMTDKNSVYWHSGTTGVVKIENSDPDTFDIIPGGSYAYDSKALYHLGKKVGPSPSDDEIERLRNGKAITYNDKSLFHSPIT